MWPGLFAFVGIVLLVVAAIPRAPKDVLYPLAAAALATAVCWRLLTAIGG